ncbi:MAG: hypothetical protein ACOCTN_00405, partial [Candidatus Natronoplasma sp.]
ITIEDAPRLQPWGALTFKDITKIVSYSCKDSGILIDTVEENERSLGPGLGGDFGKSLLDAYAQWINENTEKKASVIYEDFGIGFIRTGKYLVEYHSKEMDVTNESKNVITGQ